MLMASILVERHGLEHFFGTNGYRKDFFVLVQAPFLALSVVVVIKSAH